jgi:biotin operon repressor
MHEPRLKLKISCLEYCLIDTIYNLSVNPKAPIKGWCSAGQPNLSKALGVSRQSINKSIKKLSIGGLLIKSDSGKLLKCSGLWIDEVVQFRFKSKQSLQGVNKVDTMSTKFTSNSQQSLHNNNTIDKQTKGVDFKEQSRKALELLAIAEKLESTLIDFCTLNAPQIELMMNKALFKGDYKKQLAPFVEHNVENLFFRGSPITFFVKKFTQWLRYAKNPIRRKKGATSYNNIMSEYYVPEIREKIRTRNPERFKAYEKEFNDMVVRAEVETYLKKLKNVKNKTYTPYLIYDICFGMLADKAGTKADRRFSKFKQWYGKITDYQKNQWNLRSEFQKHITK